MFYPVRPPSGSENPRTDTRRRRWLQWFALLPWGSGALALGAGAPAERERALVFPADHGAHPDTRIEWWYVTGALRAGPPNERPGELTHGFQITFFRSSTDVSADHPSRFAAQQLVFAHAALTDLRRGRLLHDQRIARAGFGIAEASTGDAAVTLRDWHFQREDAAPVAASATAAAPGASRYRARVASDSAGFAFDFSLTTTQPVLLQGDAGTSRKGPQHTSRYYSEPQLALRGTLTQQGASLPVRGTAWLDHEWSDSVLPPGAVGWDWIGMNLNDGSALTAFRLRAADGRTVYAGGSLRTAGGVLRNFSPDEVTFTPHRVWISPASQARYPIEWTLQTPAGRHRIVALLDAQELDSRHSTGTIYWEGLSELRDEQGQRIARGYLEMTGYASRLSL
jgi:predicted secreted hydrolase